MFTPEDREELIDIFLKLKEETENTLKKDNVLPYSITSNGKGVGVTIELRKLRPEKEVLPPPTPHFSSGVKSAPDFERTPKDKEV